MTRRANPLAVLLPTILLAVPVEAQSPRLADNPPIELPGVRAPRHAATPYAVPYLRQTPAEERARGAAAGTAAADSAGVGGYFLGGIAGGLAASVSVPGIAMMHFDPMGSDEPGLGPYLAMVAAVSVGVVLPYLVAAVVPVEVPSSREARIAGEPAAYRQGFREGHAEGVKGNRKRAALAGTAIGVTPLLFLLIGALLTT